jgi:hypothetical protein
LKPDFQANTTPRSIFFTKIQIKKFLYLKWPMNSAHYPPLQEIRTQKPGTHENKLFLIW